MISDLLETITEHTPISISHPSNRFWAATSVGLFGWVVTVRVRRPGERQTYRRWLKLSVFNYNYSEEAKETNRKKNNVLGRSAFPNDGREECASCGQVVPHGEESLIPDRSSGEKQSEDADTNSKREANSW